MKKGKVLERTEPFDCFVIDATKLQPGDVILTRAPGQPISELIRAITGSDYSHAILVLDPPHAIESSDYGVVRFRLDRFAVMSPENIAVRRLRPDLLTAEQMAAIKHFAGRVKTNEYAEKDVFMSVINFAPKFEEGKYFCSQLVAEAFASAGISVCAGVSAAKITPGMLAVSEVFDSVPSSEVLIERKAGGLMHIPALLDSSGSPSAAEDEAEAHQRATRLVAPKFASHDIVIHNLMEAIGVVNKLWSEEHPATAELDQALAAAIIESGLLQIASKRYPCYAPELFLDCYVFHAINSGQMSIEQQRLLLEFYRVQFDIMDATNAERDDDVTKLKRLYLNSGLESFRLQWAGTWEAFLISTRMQFAIQHAIEALESSIAQYEASTNPT